MLMAVLLDPRGKKMWEWSSSYLQTLHTGLISQRGIDLLTSPTWTTWILATDTQWRHRKAPVSLARHNVHHPTAWGNQMEQALDSWERLAPSWATTLISGLRMKLFGAPFGIKFLNWYEDEPDLNIRNGSQTSMPANFFFANCIEQ